MRLHLRFHADPGHGYLEVPMAVYTAAMGADARPSGFSFIHGRPDDLQILFLEEDCDASEFLTAASAAVWCDGVELEEIYHATRESLLRFCRESALGGLPDRTAFVPGIAGVD